jgi:hypothetical protein
VIALPWRSNSGFFGAHGDVIAPPRNGHLHEWCGRTARIHEAGASVYPSDRYSLFVDIDVFPTISTGWCFLDNRHVQARNIFR